VKKANGVDFLYSARSADDEPGNNEEDIHAREAAGQPTLVQVIDDD
jgi:hypothetical protein